MLTDILPVEPDLVPKPVEHEAKVREWLKNDEIDNLILTTCKWERGLAARQAPSCA